MENRSRRSTKKSKSKSNRNSGVRRFRLRNYSCFSPGWRMLPDLLRSRNRRFRQVRLSRPAPCAIIFMRSPQCDKLDTLVIRSHCPRKLAVQHCLAQSAAISMVLPTLTSEGALTIDLVCPRVTFGRRLYALGGGSGTEGREREREAQREERERERERRERTEGPAQSTA